MEAVGSSLGFDMAGWLVLHLGEVAGFPDHHHSEADDLRAIAIQDLIVKLQQAIGNKKVLLLIDSRGGDVEAAYDVAAAVSLHCQVTGIVTGRVDSAATLVFAACQQRYMLPQATMFFHGLIHGGVNLSFALLSDPERFEWARQSALEHQATFERAIAVHLRGVVTVEQLREWCLTERTLTSREAFDLGLIDGIIEGGMLKILVAPVPPM